MQRLAGGNRVLPTGVRCFAHGAGPLDELLNLTDPDLVKAAAFINGQWRHPSSGATFPVHDPATGLTIAHVANCGAAETRQAIAHAHEAFPAWAARPAGERAAVLRRWHAEIAAHKDDLARIMTLECGKTLAESRNEFDGGLASISWFAEEATRVDGKVLQSPARGKRFLVLKQPVGVTGAVTPFNFPFSMVTRKTAPALAAGCPVVLKPSEDTPLTALALAELARRAGLPAGCFNVVPGADAQAIGGELLRSTEVRKISFTGSTRVGKQLYAGAAATVKRVSLELGGNAPFIVFDDADVDKAARDVVGSSYRNAGQTCICTNRVLVQEGAYAAFTEALVERVKKLRVGSGLESGTTLGPLISPAAVERVAGRVAAAVGQGAVVATGGGRVDFDPGDARRGGNFYQPTVLLDARPDMAIFSEETFGPVTPVTRFKTDAEGLALANDTPYGLAAYFYTRDLGRAFRVAEGLQYGMVGVNEVAITSEVAPFGGVKQSGLGREHSRHGIEEYLDLKTVCLGLG